MKIIGFKFLVQRFSALASLGTGVVIALLVCGAIIVLNDCLREGHVESQKFDSVLDDLVHQSTTNQREYEDNVEPLGGSIELEQFLTLELDNEFFRSAVLGEYLLTCQQKELYKLLGDAVTLKPVYQQEILIDLIVRRLATIDPKESLDHVFDLPKHFHKQFVQLIFSEWVLVDLDSSIEHASTLSRELQRDILDVVLQVRDDLSAEASRAIGVRLDLEDDVAELLLLKRFSSFVKHSSDAFDAVMNESRTEDQRLSTLMKIVRGWVDQYGFELLEQLSEVIPNRRIRTQILHELLVEEGWSNPKFAINFAMGISDITSDETVITVARNWAHRDGLAALKFLSSIDSGELRQQVESTVIHAWASGNPYLLLSEIELIPENIRADAQVQAIQTIAVLAPNLAAEHMGDMTQGRHKVARTIAHRWARLDFETALHWTQSTPEVGDIETELVAIVLDESNLHNADLALETALRHPVNKFGVGMEARVIGRIATLDVEIAKTLLPRVREGPTKLKAVTAIGSAMVRYSNPVKAVELSKRLVGSDRNQYYEVVFDEWAGMSPVGVFELIDQIPSKKAKSIAAHWILAHDRFQGTLTKDQTERTKSYLLTSQTKFRDESSGSIDSRSFD